MQSLSQHSKFDNGKLNGVKIIIAVNTGIDCLFIQKLKFVNNKAVIKLV